MVVWSIWTAVHQSYYLQTLTHACIFRSAETIDVQEMERIYDVVPTEDEEDPYGDESIYAAVVTYQPMVRIT